MPVTREPGRKGRQRTAGSMRDKNFAWKRLQRDLRALELRGRRAHDLRRTGISLAQGDGADRAILKWGTHAPPRDVMSLYTTHDWRVLCAEVAKLRIERRSPGSVVKFVGAVGAEGDFLGASAGARVDLRVRKPGM